jgi:hypothetical protein
MSLKPLKDLVSDSATDVVRRLEFFAQLVEKTIDHEREKDALGTSGINRNLSLSAATSIKTTLRTLLRQASDEIGGTLHSMIAAFPLESREDEQRLDQMLKEGTIEGFDEQGDGEEVASGVEWFVLAARQRFSELHSQLDKSKMMLRVARARIKRRNAMLKYLEETLHKELIYFHEQFLTAVDRKDRLKDVDVGVFSFINFLELLEPKSRELDSSDDESDCEIDARVANGKRRKPPRVKGQGEPSTKGRGQSDMLDFVGELSKRWKAESSARAESESREETVKSVVQTLQSQCEQFEKQMNHISSRYTEEMGKLKAAKIGTERKLHTATTDLAFAINQLRTVQDSGQQKDTVIESLNNRCQELESLISLMRLDAETGNASAKGQLAEQAGKVLLERQRISKVLAKLAESGVALPAEILAGGDDSDDPMLADLLKNAQSLNETRDQLEAALAEVVPLREENNNLKTKLEELEEGMLKALRYFVSLGLPIPEELAPWANELSQAMSMSMTLSQTFSDKSQGDNLAVMKAMLERGKAVAQVEDLLEATEFARIRISKVQLGVADLLKEKAEPSFPSAANSTRQSLHPFGSIDVIGSSQLLDSISALGSNGALNGSSSLQPDRRESAAAPAILRQIPETSSQHSDTTPVMPSIPSPLAKTSSESSGLGMGDTLQLDEKVLIAQQQLDSLCTEMEEMLNKVKEKTAKDATDIRRLRDNIFDLKQQGFKKGQGSNALLSGLSSPLTPEQFPLDGSNEFVIVGRGNPSAKTVSLQDASTQSDPEANPRRLTIVGADQQSPDGRRPSMVTAPPPPPSTRVMWSQTPAVEVEHIKIQTDPHESLADGIKAVDEYLKILEAENAKSKNLSTLLEGETTSPGRRRGSMLPTRVLCPGCGTSLDTSQCAPVTTKHASTSTPEVVLFHKYTSTTEGGLGVGVATGTQTIGPAVGSKEHHHQLPSEAIALNSKLCGLSRPIPTFGVAATQTVSVTVLSSEEAAYFIGPSVQSSGDPSVELTHGRPPKGHPAGRLGSGYPRGDALSGSGSQRAAGGAIDDPFYLPPEFDGEDFQGIRGTIPEAEIPEVSQRRHVTNSAKRRRLYSAGRNSNQSSALDDDDDVSWSTTTGPRPVSGAVSKVKGKSNRESEGEGKTSLLNPRDRRGLPGVKRSQSPPVPMFHHHFPHQAPPPKPISDSDAQLVQHQFVEDFGVPLVVYQQLTTRKRRLMMLPPPVGARPVHTPPAGASRPVSALSIGANTSFEPTLLLCDRPGTAQSMSTVPQVRAASAMRNASSASSIRTPLLMSSKQLILDSQPLTSVTGPKHQ